MHASHIRGKRAYSDMLHSQGEYSKALQYFSKCHDLYQALDDRASLEATRAHYGVAQVHHNMASFTTSIGQFGSGDMIQLMRWKAQRTPLDTPITTLVPPTDDAENTSSRSDSIHDNSETSAKETGSDNT